MHNSNGMWDAPVRGMRATDDIVRMRAELGRLKGEMIIARREVQEARDQNLYLKDKVAAAERDQQDLRTARARLARMKLRAFLMHVLRQR